MGRNGNQASQFLGVLALAKSINRTLVVPPIITYDRPPIVVRPYTEFYNLSALAEYANVIDMETFMTEIAPQIWPPENRKSYCYSSGTTVICRAKQGNPMEGFWNTFHVDFMGEVGVPYGMSPAQWVRTFPPAEHPVIAMPHAPGAFPVAKENYPLAQYVRWNDNFKVQAQAIVDEHLARPYLAAHVRAGSDWVKACSSSSWSVLMESSQCDHLRPKARTVGRELCLPTPAEIVDDMAKIVAKFKLKSVLIGTDDPTVLDQIRSWWQRKSDVSHIPLVSFRHDPMLDMALFTMADHFIGNCVSSFTAIAIRDRRVNQKPFYFWSLVSQGFDHDEL